MTTTRRSRAMRMDPPRENIPSSAPEAFTDAYASRVVRADPPRRGQRARSSADVVGGDGTRFAADGARRPSRLIDAADIAAVKVKIVGHDVFSVSASASAAWAVGFDFPRFRLAAALSRRARRSPPRTNWRRCARWRRSGNSAQSRRLGGRPRGHPLRRAAAKAPAATSRSASAPGRTELRSVTTTTFSASMVALTQSVPASGCPTTAPIA